MTATILQLNPPIWVETPKGEGHALFLIDYGVSINTIWVVHLLDSAKVIHVDSSEIRVYGNEMWNIPHPQESIEKMTKEQLRRALER